MQLVTLCVLCWEPLVLATSYDWVTSLYVVRVLLGSCIAEWHLRSGKSLSWLWITLGASIASVAAAISCISCRHTQVCTQICINTYTCTSSHTRTRTHTHTHVCTHTHTYMHTHTHTRTCMGLHPAVYVTLVHSLVCLFISKLIVWQCLIGNHRMCDCIQCQG